MKRALWLLLFAAACTTNRTEVVVVVSQQGLVIGRDIDKLHISIVDTALGDGADATRFDSPDLVLCNPPSVTTSCYDLPLIQTLLPGPRSPGDSVRVVVDAMLGSQLVTSDAATFTFMHGHSEQLDFELIPDCLGNTTCGASGTTCMKGGTCSNITPTPIVGNPDLRAGGGVPSDLSIVDMAVSLDAGAHDAGPPPDATMVHDMTPPGTCSDDMRNGNETDDDCGGRCGPCALGQGCGVAADCKTFVCSTSTKCINLAFTSKDVSTLNSPTGVAVGKFDGTTHVGFATGTAPSPGPGQVEIYSNDGKGNFSQIQTLGTFHDGPQGLRSFSLTSSNRADLVVTEVGAFVGVMLNNGNSNSPFSSSVVEMSIGTGMSSAYSAFDSATSALFVASSSGTLEFSNNMGTEMSQGSVNPGNTASVAVGDLNGDKIPDVVSCAGSSIYYASSIKAYEYNAPVTLPSQSSGVPSAVILVDLDGDAHLDAVVGYINTADVTIYWGAVGGFSSKVTKLTVPINQAATIVAGDFNKDGIIDFATGNRGDNATTGSVSIFLNHGGQNIDGPRTFPMPTSGERPYSIDVADFNEDGWLDWVVAARFGTEGSVVGFNNPK